MKSVWILHHTANAEKTVWETERLYDQFSANNIKCQVLQPKNFDIITSRRNPKSIRYHSEPIVLPDAVLVRTGSTTNYFTSALLRQLQGFDVPVVNNVDAILKCKDKMLSGQILAQNKIPVPRTMLVNFPVDSEIVEKEIGFPCIVKLVSGSHGQGVYKCEDRKFFQDLMELIQNLKTKKSILVQEYVSYGQPADIRVWAIGGRAVTAMKRFAPEGDFRANISNGGTGEPIKLNKEMIEISEKVANLFNIDIAGIDLLYDGKHYKVCEVNSSPQFQGIDTFCKTNMAKHIVEFIKTKF